MGMDTIWDNAEDAEVMWDSHDPEAVYLLFKLIYRIRGSGVLKLYYYIGMGRF